MRRGWRWPLLIAVLWTPVLPWAPASAQTVMERTPNVGGIWVPGSGRAQMNFLHRFRVLDPPSRKVLADPTFLVAVGVTGATALGARYAPSSALVLGHPNEWEVFGKWVAARQAGGGWADVGVQLSHNVRAGGVDGELLLARDVGRLRLLGGARGYSSFAAGDGEVGVVAGARVRLTRHVAVGGDWSGLLGDAAPAGWSAGLQMELPYTPHSLSLHVTNVEVVTLQGASLGGSARQYGFEFTAPLTWSRLRGEAGRAARAEPMGGEAGEVGAVVEMDNGMSFLPDTVRIRVGQVVEWRNGGVIIHTVTAVPGRSVLADNVALPPGADPFDSGDLRPDETFRHRFTVAGVYRYVCVPHEMAGMVGVVVVEGGG